MAVLGAILVDRAMFFCASALLEPTDFYAHVHVTIYRHIAQLIADDMPVDSITLAEHLKAAGKLEKVGGLAYMNVLRDIVPTAASVEYYARIVAEKARLRDLMRAGRAIEQLGWDESAAIEDTLQQADRVLRAAITAGAQASSLVTLQTLLPRLLASLDATSGELWDTPWPSLNRLIGGLGPGQLALWGGDGGVGKSGAALQLADYVATHHGAVLYVTLEMEPAECGRRLIAMRSGISVRRQLQNDMGPTDYELYADAMGALADTQIEFLGGECDSIGKLRRELLVRRGQRLVAIVVDYVSLLRDVTATRTMTENDALSQTYRELLRIARDERCVVHALQHLNRAPQLGAKPRRPRKSDLRGGGNPEGHAHLIVLLHREAPEEEPERGEMIVAKARNGAQDILPMQYSGFRHSWAEATNAGP